MEEKHSEPHNPMFTPVIHQNYRQAGGKLHLCHWELPYLAGNSISAGRATFSNIPQSVDL